MAQLIGLIGRKRSGKDTFASALAEVGGYTRVAFADPLKQAALALDPIVGPAPLPGDCVSSYRRLSEVVEALGWETAKDVVPEVRPVLQRLGTDAIRALDDNFWVEAGMERAGAIGGPVVFTDCRFPNEADAIRAAGGFIVRINRDLPDDGDKHPSEVALDDYEADAEYDNNRPLEDMLEAAKLLSLVVAAAG